MDKTLDGTDNRVDARQQGSDDKSPEQDQTSEANQSTSTTFCFEEAYPEADSFGSCSSLASSVASSSAAAAPQLLVVDFADDADVSNHAELDVVSDEAAPGRFVVEGEDLMDFFNSPTKKRKYTKADVCSPSFDVKRHQTVEPGSDVVTQFPASSPLRSPFSSVPSADHQTAFDSLGNSILFGSKGFENLNTAECEAVDLSRTANFVFSDSPVWNRKADADLHTTGDSLNNVVDLSVCKESIHRPSVLNRAVTDQNFSNHSFLNLVADTPFSFASTSSFAEQSKLFTSLESRGHVVMSNNESTSPSGAHPIHDTSTENSSDPSETSSIFLMASSDTESEEREVTRLQAVLEARGLPSQFLNSFTSRMNQLSERAASTAATGKQIQELMQRIETSADEGEILVTLIELCQLLVMGNEESLAGFPIRQAVPVLTRFLQMDHNFDIMHQACRALTYLLEGLPRSSQAVSEAVPVLLEKLQSIECMDVAEQSLRALELLSRKHSKTILQRNGVATSLMFMDFFSITAQRSALAITANCCLSMTIEEFCFIQESLPLITSRLTNQDKKLVESACQCLARLVDNCQLEERILKEIAVHGLLTDVQQLLFVTPPVISTSMLVTVLHMLVVMCFNCPDLAIILLKLNVAETISYLLIGTSEKGRTGGPPELITRSPQELFEIVSLVGELMPMLPNEGLFAIDALLGNTSSLTKHSGIWQWKDNNDIWRSYNAVDNRIIEMAHQSGETVVSLTSMGRAYVIDFNIMQQINEDTGTTRQVQRKVSSTGAKPDTASVKGDSRADVLYENSELANGLTSTLFAVLFEVYCSSAALFVRHKCLRTLLRMLFYGSAELLSGVLQMVPVSSHLAAMLSSNDLQTVVSSIQICNILMMKLPEVFSIYFRRQGVLHQMNKLIQSTAIDLSAKKKASLAVPLQGTAVDHSAATVLAGNAAGVTVQLSAAAAVEKPAKDAAKPSSPGTQLRLSDVLKRKKPIRKSPKKTGKVDEDNSELSPSSTTASGTEGSSRSLPGSSHGRLFGARDSRIGGMTPKSFLASLNPTRWGRSSQSVSERPLVARKTPLNKSTSDIGHHVVNNRELVKQWISDHAAKFIKKFFDGDVEGLSHPSLAVFKRLCSSVGFIGQDSQTDATYLQQVADVLGLNDVSPFEVIQSGLIKKLLSYFTSTAVDSVTMDAQLKTFIRIFIGQPKSEAEWGSGQWEILSPPPLLHLVNKLMACFHHLEQFQIKVHDLRDAGSGGRGLQITQFFHSQQIKCNLQLHPNCKGGVRMWKGGTISVDPFAPLYSIERYIILKGFGQLKNSEESDDDDDDDDDDEVNDDDEEEEEEEDNDDSMEDGEVDDTLANFTSLSGLNHVLEFLIGDHVVPYHMTVYQAVKQFSSGKEGSDAVVGSPHAIEESAIWTQNHTFWYRPISLTRENQHRDAYQSEKQKPESVSSPSSTTAELFTHAESLNLNRLHILKSFLMSVLPNTMTFDDPALEVLSLLRILHALNSEWTTVFNVECSRAEPAIGRQEFVSNKLTAKVSRQLQEQAVITNGHLPHWLIQLANICPFLLPFENRLLLFCATALDRDRAVQRIQDLVRESVTTENGDRHAAGRLERKKKIISRDDILKQAETAVSELIGSRAILEIQYENEVGSGLGPTLEFYALVSQELQRADLDLWRGEKRQLQNDCSEEQRYIYSPSGLFPAPIPQNLKSQSLRRIKSKFSFLGKFMARALTDSRILDLPLSVLFYKWLLGKESTLCVTDLHYVDSDLFFSISKLQQLLREKKRIETDAKLSPDLRKNLLDHLTLNGCSVEDLGLDFTLPGYPAIDLKKGGKDISVTLDNLEEYIQFVVKWSLVYGVQHQFEAVREGFESILPLHSLGLFFPEEMDQLFCGSQQEQWSSKYLTEVCQTDHGYNHDSQAVKHLFSILSSYSRDEQRLFLQFVTGSPRLPVGGLKSLNPPLTIVRKTDSREYADDFLPSVMTCVNYLKLPDYSSIEVMRNKLAIALREGQLSFHLS